jgi:hypothetical protein
VKSQNYILALSRLILGLQSSQSNEKEIVASLTLPFVKFLVETVESEMGEIVYKAFDQTLLSGIVEQKHLREVFFIYTKACLRKQTQLKNLFIEKAPAVFKSDVLATCLDKAIAECEDNEIELTLETLIQISSPSAKLLEITLASIVELNERF